MKDKRKKNIIFACDDKGGVGKSTASGCIADAAMAMGYTVRLIDADPENTTLSKMFEQGVTCIEASAETFQATLENLSIMTEDFAIVDLPGAASAFFKDYFARNSRAAFDEMGLRIIIAVTVCETRGALDGAKKWVEMFGDMFEFIAVINEKDTALNKNFELNNYNTGQIVLEYALNHHVRIPRMVDHLKHMYDRWYGAPSDFIPRGRLAVKYKLSPLSTGQWNVHRDNIIRSVALEIEWLAGRPIPTPIDSIASPNPAEDSARMARMARLHQED